MPPSTVVTYGPHRVTVLHYRESDAPWATLVLAHGAGANQTSPFMTATASALAARGIAVVTFNFPYTEQGRRAPDPMPTLEGTFRAVLDAVARDNVDNPAPLFIGGKSMGGRVATHLASRPSELATAAWGPRFTGVLCLGYPLHPPARPQQLRVDHLARITHPVLMVQGTRDVFGTPAEVEVFTSVLGPGFAVLAVDGGDHSFDVLKRSGLNQATVFIAVLDSIEAWMRKQIGL